MRLSHKTFEDLVSQNIEELLSDEELLTQIELRLENKFTQQKEEN